MAKSKGEGGVWPKGMQSRPGKDANASAKVPKSLVKQPALSPGYTRFKKFSF